MVEVNQDHFEETRDFTVFGKGLNTASIQARKDALNEALKAEQEEQRNEDVKGFVTDSFNKATSDARQEFMHSINGRHFSDADLEEALNDIIENKEEFQAKHELTDEETDLAVTHAIIMKSMTPEQRDDYLKDLSETNPTVANAIADQAEAKAISQDNKAENTSNASDAEVNAKNNFLDSTSNNEGSFETFTKVPSTGTTDIFNSFANTSDATPEITPPEPNGTDNIPAPVI